MKNWIIYYSPLGYGDICGECAEKHGESNLREFITQAVEDSTLYTRKCDFCGKSAGNYFAHFQKLEAA